MSDIVLYKKLISHLKKNGYTIVTSSIPDEFSFNPDILARKGKITEAFLIRESADIPEVMIQRMASIHLIRTKLRIFIIFRKKPKKSTIKNIILYGIGIKYFYNNQLVQIYKSRYFSTIKKTKYKKGARKKKKMTRTDIFISSHQTIEERRTTKELINEFKRAHKFPIFPILVEEDPRYDISQTRKCIKRNMDDSELFIGILTEEYRPDVNYEVRRAFNNSFKSSEIMIFIKAIKHRPKSQINLINWIKKQKNVKYQIYTDIKDFRVKLMNTIMIKMKETHEKLKIPFME